MSKLNEMDRDTLFKMMRQLPLHIRVATLRTMAGMSQQQLADRVGNNRRTVSTWEQHPDHVRAHQPDRTARGALARVFGLPAFVFTEDFGSEESDVSTDAMLHGSQGQEPARTQQVQFQPTQDAFSGPAMQQVDTLAKAEAELQQEPMPVQTDAREQAETMVVGGGMDEQMQDVGMRRVAHQGNPPGYDEGDVRSADETPSGVRRI